MASWSPGARAAGHAARAVDDHVGLRSDLDDADGNSAIGMHRDGVVYFLVGVTSHLWIACVLSG